jgi:two-component system sensor histidine kinase CpxA
MRGLFAKIFVTFFLTVVLLGVLLEITAVRTEMRRVDEVFRPLAERLAPQVADDYDQRGADALAADLRRLPVAAALLDEQAQPIGVVSDPIRAQLSDVQSLVADAPEPLSRFVAWKNLAVVPVTAASGRRYYFAFVIPHERWMAILNTLDQYPAVRLSLVGLVAGLICFLLARHITRPLVDLRATARRMAEGHLEARAGAAIARRHDEIGSLGRDFDVMADRLNALVTSQSRLFADVSHELRSPLGRLTVAAGLIRQHLEDVPVDRRPLVVADLERIEREASRLDALIGQALTLARVESGVEAGPRQAFDLTNLVQEVAADGDYEARASGRRVVMREAEPCTMVGVADLVRSAVENVVRNAIRYTHPGTTVEVSLQRIERDRSTWASLRVKDHGPGIATDVGELFKPIRRGEPPADRRPEGAGLGLAIVSRVVETHGGTVRADNIPSSGLDVEIVLPLRL